VTARVETPRNRDLGQVWTPEDIALSMARKALGALPGVRFVLDPACGPGTFSRALAEAGGKGLSVDAYDVDPAMAERTAAVNREAGLAGAVACRDYLLEEDLAGRYDLVIMNPPYIRQELLDPQKKDLYHARIRSALLGERPDRRSNLFALFLLKAAADLRPGGILCAIVYDAVTQAAYGRQVLRILARFMELESSEPVRAPFDGVLVDAQVLLFRKRAEPLEKAPAEVLLPPRPGFARLSDLLSCRRGTTLPKREVFWVRPGDPHGDRGMEMMVKQAALSGLLVRPDRRAYLAVDPEADPELAAWLKARADGQDYSGPLWGIRPVRGPILMNYYVRGFPRHLWNPERVPAADNFYVSAPKGAFPAEAAWVLLNTTEAGERILAGGRNQGNGLVKVQMYEYAAVELPDWRILDPGAVAELALGASALAARDPIPAEARRDADILAKKAGWIS
jgi:SAM-dependent methyltransferase